MKITAVVRTSCLGALLLLLSGAVASAQSYTEDNVGVAIRRAYDLSQAAPTKQGYTEIAELCERIAASPIAAKKVEYAKNLAAWAYNRRGELHAEQAAAMITKQDNDAATEFETLAIADFNRSVTLDPTKWKAYHNRGVSNAQRGKFEAALVDFSRALELEQEYANTWFNRGEVYFELAKYREAIEDYNQSLEFTPNDPQLLSRRGRAMMKSSQYAAAVADFTRVLRLAPQDAGTYVDRAEAAVAMSQWQSAAGDYRQAIRLDPSLGRAYLGAAWLMATSPIEELRSAELGLQAAQKAAELMGRDDHRTLDCLAAAYANAGQFEQAVANAKQAVAAAPKQSRADLQKRLVEYEAGRPYRSVD